MSIETRTRAGRPRVEPTASAASGWRQGLPVYGDPAFTLRDLQIGDAPSLLAHLATEEVTRFISPPPSTIAGFERFIQASLRDREGGQTICFALVPAGATRAVGIFQLRSLEAGFASGEWGFAMGSAYWGTGLFVGAVTPILDFAFETVGILRLEARAVVANGRGNGALRKIGAVQEGVLRRSFLKRGQYYDQVMWSMLADDWLRKRSVQRTRIH